MTKLKEFLQERRQVVEGVLQRYAPSEDRFPPLIHKAMRYSLFSGGKRLRPILVLECCRICGGSEEEAFPAASAVEFIHTYSLIHDDLPAMDDDDFRRGKPTCHKVFGEAVAILAGDGLLTLAFEALSRIRDGVVCKKAVAELARAAGSAGMVGGQTLDITPPAPDEPHTERVYLTHLLKTAAMIEVSCRLGAICAKAPQNALNAVSSYGRNLGLAFQITDDILDVVGEEEKVGKRLKKDTEKGRLTYPSVFGLEESLSEARRLVSEAKAALNIFAEKADNLCALADFILTRTH